MLPLKRVMRLILAAMDPVVAPFREIVAGITLNPPRIPIISSVTGTYLKDSEATSPEYWANHLRATVRFSDATAFTVKEFNPVFLESGPGNVLSSYIKQQNKQWVALEKVSPPPGLKASNCCCRSVGCGNWG